MMTEKFNAKSSFESNLENSITYDQLRKELLDGLGIQPGTKVDDSELINRLRRSFNLDMGRIPVISSAASVRYEANAKDMRFDQELLKILEDLAKNQQFEIPKDDLKKVRLMRNSPEKAFILKNLFRTKFSQVIK